jgi:hypothetical protein
LSIGRTCTISNVRKNVLVNAGERGTQFRGFSDALSVGALTKMDNHLVKKGDPILEIDPVVIYAFL